MTATNHFMTPRNPDTEFTLGTILRWFTRMVGVALVLLGLGVWIAPTASALPELAMIKLCATVFSALSGGHLLYVARAPGAAGE